jgi:hypothetical protein
MSNRTMRVARVAAASLAAALLVNITPLVASPTVAEVVSQTAPRFTTSAEPQVAGHWLRSRAYFNDPSDRQSHPTRQLVIDHFDRALPGSQVRMETWSLSDPGIADAVERAIRAGVQVRVLLPRTNCNYPATRQLEATASRNTGSWVECVTGSARVAGGTLHQKSYTFSALGSKARQGLIAQDVTVVGSANATESGATNQWVDMYQFMNRPDVFRRYNQVFAFQAPDIDRTHPYRQWCLNHCQDTVQFYPVNAVSPKASNDPVHRRLTQIPGGRHTSVTVANYAIWGDRGTWLGAQLIRLVRSGSTVHLIAGPRSSTHLVHVLGHDGVHVTMGFDGAGTAHPCPGKANGGSCNYVHLKAMIARYRDHGQQYRVWTGSDNWGDKPLRHDEVVQEISGHDVYRQYAGFMSKIRGVYR